VWSPNGKRRTGLLRDRNVGVMSRFKAFDRLSLPHRSANEDNELRIDDRWQACSNNVLAIDSVVIEASSKS
jgi:hypothetical protein